MKSVQLLTELTTTSESNKTNRTGDKLRGRALDLWSKGPWFDSWQEQRDKNKCFLCQLSVLILTSASVPPPWLIGCKTPSYLLAYHPRDTAVKDPGHPAKSAGGRQITADTHPTCVAWNKVTLQTGAWLYGAHRTCPKTAAVSRGTSHVTAKARCRYTTLVDIQKHAV